MKKLLLLSLVALAPSFVTANEISREATITPLMLTTFSLSGGICKKHKVSPEVQKEMLEVLVLNDDSNLSPELEDLVGKLRLESQEYENLSDLEVLRAAVTESLEE
ncbi:hypothetical protein [Bacteriovorax sp. Seq25_V]|uniref:hypothetical protein n=1 Tax=Bacteriovorax sp. Seq25_V TaxID=1201288 RepID=UPI00038A0F90|nr:hypothetical protein [Bacteriovorax sp. Seq25_V]EQC44381.1 hypothetical protein M900_A0478 [Bacteriovorax sp. Seq25_V]